ncbi:hypothetical protein K2173_003602 [Erythroxylum novogranatense]|uniref:DUF676 domain-containing protein n=1 Tax=Erythroxylum novogranatense TaxID=1862640 RepID=A0AAV8TC05_9ROSI|nr:hypothetical protein K2173_003602 [Erythroxylum novogranatense]
MFRRIGFYIGIDSKNINTTADNNNNNNRVRPPDANFVNYNNKIEPISMSDAMQEIAIYIHRFHNLDLFQQGWYQIKISMRWEDSDYAALGTPSRVVQYEAPDLGADEPCGVWRINDKENSFSTQPFRIKYSKQDIRLCIMISFSLSLSKYKGPSTSAVILKFELLQAPITISGLDLLTYLDSSSVAVHEFRIPPKALLGLHSYCPVNFDAFHSVLVDATVHTSLLRATTHMKVSSTDGFTAGTSDALNQDLGKASSMDVKLVALVKAFLIARDTWLEDLRKLSLETNQPIDLSEFISNLDDINMLDSLLQVNLGAADGGVSSPGKRQNIPEKANVITDFQKNRFTPTLAEDAVLSIVHALGSQLSYLWNMFLQFHRANKTKILELLRDAWTRDRRAEWSIWMVYSKVEMPHQYISSGADDISNHGVYKRVSALRKLTDDSSQTAATRAEHHRRSIAQMKIDNRSLQDMHIFGDPLRIPIVIVERVINAPRRTFSENSYFRNVDLLDSSSLLGEFSTNSKSKPSPGTQKQNGHDLKVAIFVHGFQGHHLDLRLVRNQWLLIDPKLEFLMSEVNEEKTSGDFRDMGLRLAEEVISFLKKKMDRVTRSGPLRDIKLSFVGHSIGNIIIRTALAESIMEPYLRFLYTYVSISGPHLGYLYNQNSLFNSGMWLLKKLKGAPCIHQLTFTDDPDLENTFLYRLCQQKTLQNFRHILLLSSPQDGYVPYHSARIELCRAASMDYSKKGKIFLEMLNNCLDQIRTPTSEHRQFMRCDVNFDTSSYGKNLNTLIGRAAHIDFLESDVFAKFIMWSFPELFR